MGGFGPRSAAIGFCRLPSDPFTQMAPVTSQQLQEAAGRLRPLQQRLPATSLDVSQQDRPIHQESASDSDGAEATAVPPFCITLRFMDGSEYQLQARPRDLARDIRSQVCEKLGVTDSRVKLLSGASVLYSYDHLDAHGVCEGSVITVIVVPPLYEGTQLYTRVMDSLSPDLGTDAAHQALEEVMEKKANLNDTFASLIRLRKCRVD